MESDRHKFMRELMMLCERHGVTIGRGGACIDKVGESYWIDDLTVTEDSAVGYWDGECHEVQP